MSKKIVCISFINESFEFVEVKRSNIGNLTLSPSFASTKESLLAACARADEIYVSSLFPTEQYEREIFPKVKDRYLHPIIIGFIQKKNPATDVSVRYKHVRDVIMDGKPSPLVALQSVAKADVENILDLFKRYRKKIKSIYTLPAALAGAVVNCEKPTGNTMFLWIKEKTALLAVISADGAVDIARSIPFTIPDEDTDTGHMDASTFSEDISREVIMTANYFKQNFRESAPEKLYLLGDRRLQKIFADFPVKFSDIPVQFGLPEGLPKGMDTEIFNENVHLLGAMFANESFSFLPIREVEDRKANTILSWTLAGVGLLIGAAALWTFSIPGVKPSNDLVARVQELRFDIQDLETSIGGLKSTEARKEYYQSAFLDKKPEFISILLQTAAIAPPEMVYESFTMSPAKGSWNCMITGKIKGRDWQERLDILRKFGKALYSFPNFDIQNINHSLGQAGMDSESISFQVSLQFIPGDDQK